MTCARREAGAHRPAASSQSRPPSPPQRRLRPDPRSGRRGARLFLLLPVLALLLGALGPFAAAPAQAQTTVWSATLTVQATSNSGGCGSSTCPTALTQDKFTHGGIEYTIAEITVYFGGGELSIATNKNGAYTALSGLTLTVGSGMSAKTFKVSDAEGRNNGRTLYWSSNQGLSWSSGDTVSLSLTAPAAKPTGLTATAGNAKVDLSWTDPSDSSITKYQVRQKEGSNRWGSWTDIPSSSATTTSHAVTGLKNGTAYRFRIRAVNAAGEGPQSAVAGPATPAATTTTPTPSGAVWSATLTVQVSSTSVGCSGSSACSTRLTNNKFTHGGIEYTIEHVSLVSGGSFSIWTNKNGAYTALSGLTLTVGSGMTAKTFRVSDATANVGGGSFYWTNSQGLSWSANDMVALALTAPAANSAATGKPSITGTATVGQTLTAAKGTIADTNGVTKADNGDAGFAYTYQWIRVDSDGSSNAANISGATSSTYVLKAADQGKKVKVKLSFKDDAGNAESRTSDAYPASGTVAASTTPTPSGAVWSATLTVEGVSLSHGCSSSSACSTRLTNNKFTHGGIEYTITRIDLVTSGSLEIDTNNSGAYTALSGLTLTVGSGPTAKTFRVSDATSQSGGAGFLWNNSNSQGLRWSVNDMVALSLAATAANSTATGKPSITGTATVGQTLTAAKGTVADTDGLTKADNGDAGFAYTYQWIRTDSDGSNPANIPGATSSAYVLKAADLGKKVRVKLSFKDDAGNAESRTSDAFPASGTVNSTATGKPSITGTATVGQTLTAAKGTVADANGVTKADNGDAGFAYTYQWIRMDSNSDGVISNAANISGATSSTYVLKAADLGKKVRVKLSFKDDAGNAESRTSDAYPASGTVNSVATGKPTITGTATVGQTLTAAKGTIADANGVTRADNGDAGFAYAYQWIRVDSDGSSNAANISGAIYRTYVLKAADRGKKVKVKLSFKDDAGNFESRTSDAYPASGTVAAGATWSATLTVQAASASAGCFERVCPTRLTEDKFTHGGIEYTIGSIVLFNGGPLQIYTNKDGAHTALSGLTLTVGRGMTAKTFRVSDATSRDRGRGFTWTNVQGLSWSANDMVALALTEAAPAPTPNNAATGEPSITGTATVGQTLTAAKGTIADANGVTKADNGDAGFAYTYQWIRVDSDGSSNAADISGATSSTYVLKAADQGKKVKVKLSFKDDAGNAESRTSDAYPATGTIAAANVAPAFSSAETFSVAENQTDVGTVAAADADSADSVTGYAITGGADQAKFAIVAGTGVLTFAAAPDFEDPQDAASTSPSNDAANNEYVLVVTATGGTGGRAMTAEQTIVVTVTNVDEAGSVTFGSTTPTVGTALTANVEDPDGGVSSVTWKWAKSSTKGGTYADISGATSASYTPAADDEDAWLRATAGYTDAEGTGKSAAAVAAAAVAAAPDTTAPTVTSAETGYYGDAGATTALAGPLKSGADIYTKVTFSEDMKHVKSDAAAARPELSYRIGTTDTQYHILDSGDTLASGDCRPEDSTSTDVYICFYTVGSSDSGAFTVKAGTNSEDKADNALTAAYTHAATLTLDTTAPAAPASLAAEAGDAKVTLTWSDPSPADATISKWQYRQKDSGSYGEWQDVTGGASARSVEVGSLSNGTAYTFQVRAVDTAANEGAAGTTDEVTPAAADNTAPTVTSGSTGFYGDAGATTALAGPLKSGADIYTKVTFSEDMKHVKSDAAAARPELSYRIGTTDTQYHILDSGDTLASGDCRPEDSTSTDVYICFYTVGSSDSGAFTVKAGTNSVDAAGNALAAAYTHAATLTLDTTAPTATSGSTGYYEEAGATTALTGPLKSGADIYTKVTFSEDMKHVKSDAAAARPELSYRIGTTDTQYHILDSGDTLASGDCRPEDSTSTDVYICFYTVGSSDSGAFTVKAGTNSVDEAGNALAAVYTHAATLALDTTAPAAPSGLALASGTTSPGADATPSIEVTVGETGGAVTLYSDAACTTAASVAADVTDATSPYTVTVDATALTSDGSVTFYATHADAAGNASACSTVSVAYVHDGTDPGIVFPSGVTPTVGTAATFTLTDETSKIAKYGAIPVAGASTDATGCDTATEIGSGNLTTLATPASPVDFEYTPPADSAGKKVCAYAEDAAGNSHAELWGTAIAAANAAPAFSSDAAFSAAENQTAVGTVAAADADSADSVTYAVTGGADQAKFAIVADTGVLTFAAAPDFEDPQDAASTTPSNDAANNEYVLVVTATGGSGARAMTAEQTIVVTVTNVDEDGSVTFGSTAPTVGTALTASVEDPDGGVTSVTWQWAKSSTKGGTYADISGATSASYTPAADDAGAWLRATAGYTDAEGTGKSAAAVAAAAVAAATTTTPTPSGGIWSATLTVDQTSLYAGCGTDPSLNDCATTTVLSEDQFKHGEPEQTFTITDVYRYSDTTPGTGALSFGFSGLTGAQAKTALSALTLTVTKGGASTTLKVSDATTSNDVLQWASFSGASWGDGDTVSLSLNAPAAKPAKPTGLTATAGNAKVDLSWTDPSDSSITKYQVQQKAGTAAWGGWTDVPSSGATTTSYTVTGLMNGTAYRFRIRAVNAAGNSPQSAVAGPATPAASDTTAPTVTAGSTGFYSDAAAATALTGPLKSGADIYTKVTFSEDMKHVKSDAAAARPELSYRIGSTDTQYHILDSGDTLASGDCKPEDSTSTDVYICFYTVGSSDDGAFTVKAGTNSVDKADNALAAAYTHAATLTLDNTAPTVTAGSTGYYSDAAAATALTGPLKSGADIYTKVTFSEDMKHVKSDAAAARPELSYRIGTTDTQYHILDSGDTLASGDCRPEDSTSTDVYICFYTVGSSDSGAFTVKAGTNSEDKADNALTAAYTHAATLTLDTTAPAAPASLAAEAGDAKVTLTWSDPSPADATISKWQYRQKDSGSYGEWQDVTGGASARSVEVGSLSNGTAYTFQVRAVDTAANEGAAGTTDEVTPAAADNTAPTVTSGSTGYYSDAAAATALTGPLKSGADIYTKVTFSEDMKHVKSDAAAARPELSYRIGTTDTQYHILDSGDTLASGDCKPEDSTSTDVYICFYTVGASDNGAFTVKAGTNSADEAGNALAAVYTHAATLALDTTAPGIAWPTSWAPKTGVSGTIVLTDSNAKIAKYGAIPVVGTSTDATACDTAAEIGAGNLTTLTTPSASVNFAYTPPANSATKKVCAYAEDAAGNSHALLYGTAIAQSAPAQPTGLMATAGNAQVDLAWTDPSDSTITKYQVAYKKKSASGSASFADISGSGATTTSHTVTGLDNGDVYQFWLRAVNSAGNGTDAGPVEATPAASDTTGPSITAIAISSSPDANTESQYAIGKTIAVTATFDEAIVVTGTPTLKIKVGTAEKSASCARKGASGDDAKKLVCSYTVAEGDLDADGIAVEAGKLAGTIKDAANNAATLTYTAIAAQSGHKVDGVKPTITGLSIGDGLYDLGIANRLRVWVSFTEDVDVEGSPTLAVKIGTQGRTATFSSSGAGSSSKPFDYRVQAGDEDSDGVSVDAGSIALPSGAGIKDGAGNEANLAYAAQSWSNALVDAVKPAIEFPDTGPRVGAASRIVLTDTTAKVKKHGAIVVAAAATDATGCDAASELGSDLTTLDTAASPVNLDFTPPSDSLGKKVCVYAEDAAGNSHAALWSTAIAAATTTPTPSGGIWSATLTVDQASNRAGTSTSYGCDNASNPGHDMENCSTTTVLTDDDFDYPTGGTAYTIDRLNHNNDGSILYLGFSGVTAAAAKTALTGLTLTVGTGTTAKTFAIADAGAPTTSGSALTWSSAGLSWSSGDTVALSLTAAPATKPAKPADLTATAGDKQVALAWTDPSDSGITKYQVQQKAGTAAWGSWTDIPSSAPGETNATSYTVTGLKNGTAYRFRIRAVNAAGEGPQSAVAGPVTPAAAATPTPGAVWSAMLTVGHASGTAGCGDAGLPGCAPPSVLSARSFTHGGKTYTIAKLYRYALQDAGAGQLILEFSGLTAAQVKAALSGLTLTVTRGGASTVLKVSEATAVGNELQWRTFSGARWGDGDTVTLSLTGTATTPAVPPSGANKLVGNVRQAPGPLTVPFKWDAAQSFTTGRHPGGYRLTHVDIAITDASPSAPTYSVTIHAPRSSDPNSRKGALPGKALGTLTNPGGLPTRAGEFARFTASGGIELAPRSRYFVVIDVTGAGDRRVKVATVAASGGGRYVYSAATAPQAPLDGDSVANWSIGNVAWRRAAGSGGSWTKKIPRPRLQMAVYGTAKAAPQPVPAMVPAGAIWSSSLTVGRLSNFRPWYGCGNWHERFDKCPVALSDDDFTHGGAAYKFHGVGWYAKSFEERLELILRGPSGEAARAALGSLTLHVDGKAFALGDARVDFTDGFVWFSWPWEGRWDEEQLVSLALTASGTPSGAPAAAPPALEWARVNGAELALRFDKGLDESSAPSASAFSVAVAGAARAVSSVAVSADLVTLTLASAVSSGEAVTVGYAPPAEGPGLRLSGGGAAVAAFSGQAVANDTPARQVQSGLTASVASAPAEHRGTGGFEVRIAFSEAVAGRAKDAAVEVTGGTLARAARVEKRKDLWALTVNPSGYEAVTVTLPATADCAAAGAVCTADGRRLETALTHTVPGPVTVSVADARAKEGEDATLDFAVALSRAASGEVTVTYATRDGTAKKGKDYRLAKGTLVFAAGETAKTVSVAILDDAKDEGEETFRLVLKKAAGAVIADGEATGTIENDDPMPAAWLARFGRTVAGQALDAVTERLDGGGGASHVTVGGQQLSLDSAEGRVVAAGEIDAVAAALGAGPADRWPRDPWTRGGEAGAGAGLSSRAMTGRELLLGSAFHLRSVGEAGGPVLTAWGRVATGGFDGAEDGVRMDGEVTTGFLGADVSSGRWLAGAAVALSAGEGTFGFEHAHTGGDPHTGAGTMTSTLASVLPYARLAVHERLTAWATAGYGTGALTLTEQGGAGSERHEADLTMTLGALGGRGTLVAAPAGGGFALALRGDAFWVRTESEATRGLEGATADVTRLRLVLDATRPFAAGEGTLTPSLEVGVRLDGGDAETGAGVELGAGLAWSDPALGVSAELRGRWLAAHESGAYEEWGASGSVRVDPGEGGRGLSLTLAPTVGNAASGTGTLWSAADARGIAPVGEFEAARSLDAELGYGLSGPFRLGTATPYAGLGLADGSARAWRAGVRWRVAPEVSLGLEGTRSESVDDHAPEQGLMLRGAVRW